MRIPLPERGQPIDALYLYKIVEALNQLSTAVSSVSFNHTIVDTTEAGRQSVQTGQAMLYGGETRLVSREYVVKDTSKTWHIDLPPGFKYAPKVTCSVVNKGTTTTGNDVIPTITNVTKSRVDGTAKFLSSGTASVTIAITAIGIPE